MKPRPGVRIVRIRLGPTVPEVVRLVDDDDIRETRDVLEPLREGPTPRQIGVIEDSEVREVRGGAEAADVAQVVAKLLIPDRLAHRARSEEHDALTLSQRQAL